jgi:uncharacterized protein (TIGR02996 family)
MSELDALLSGIVSDPLEETRWLVLADWLEEYDDPRRAALLRLHRRLLATCCEPDSHPERVEWHARIMDLLRSGVAPCVPRHTLTLPGGVELPGVFIPPGSFRMGSPETEADRGDEQLHTVTLMRGFFVGVYPVTQAQWVSVMGANPSRFLEADSEWGPMNADWLSRQRQRYPVECVSWEDAGDFCRTLSTLTRCTVRLPTEAEWEYSCRAGTSTPFYWGEGMNGGQANCDWYSHAAKSRTWDEGTSEVGRYAAAWPHPWGLADVHGNVWEWCADRNDGRTPASAAEGRDGAQTDPIARGGSWADTPNYCRAASRYLPLSDGGDDVGFRVVFCLA